MKEDKLNDQNQLLNSKEEKLNALFQNIEEYSKFTLKWAIRDLEKEMFEDSIKNNIRVQEVEYLTRTMDKLC